MIKIILKIKDSLVSLDGLTFFIDENHHKFVIRESANRIDMYSIYLCDEETKSSIHISTNHISFIKEKFESGEWKPLYPHIWRDL
jgi:hypothetical protein